jgi:hypothetical protein
MRHLGRQQSSCLVCPRLPSRSAQHYWGNMDWVLQQQYIISNVQPYVSSTLHKLTSLEERVSLSHQHQRNISIAWQHITLRCPVS